MNGKGVFIVVVIIIAICFLLNDYGVEGLLSLLGIGIVVLVLGMLISQKKSAEEQKEREEEKKHIEMEKKRVEMERQNQLLKNLNDDTYVFPAELFFEKCREHGIDSIDNEFAEKKSLLLFKEILVEEKIPDEYMEKYELRIEEYFNAGKTEYERKEEIKRRTPQPANLSEGDKEIIKKNLRVKNLIGTDKKRRIILDVIDREKKIMGDEWEIIADEGKILKYAKNSDSRTKKQARIYLSNDIEKSKHIIENSEKELEKLKTKVVLDNYSTEELFRHLNITCSVKREYSDVLKLSVTISNRFEPDAPDDVVMVIDGTIQVDVMYEDILVDSVTVPLTDDGIPCHTAAKIITYCEKYMIGDVKYTCKVYPNHLWLMEK